MKPASGQGRKAIAAGVLMAIAALLAGRMLVASQAPQPSPMAVSKQDQLTHSLVTLKDLHGNASVDPTLHFELLHPTEDATYEGSGRNIFSVEQIVPSKKRYTTQDPSPPAPTPPPAITASIALRFFGFATLSNQPMRAFLGEGDAVFVAREGAIVDRRYRVIKIDSNAVVVEDMLERSVHTLHLPG